MFVHVVDINLPEQGSNVPLEGNWHFFSPFLTSFTWRRLKSNVRLTESGAVAETVGVLRKTWLRRRAHRVKPSTDVYLGVSFSAVVPCSGRVGGFRIPPVHR